MPLERSIEERPKRVPIWMSRWLVAAGLYNLAWGGAAVLAPRLEFSILKMPMPNYLEFWQCIGMIVGVYGIGYLIAARDPMRHWPIVLVGLLGKIFGPIGFVSAMIGLNGPSLIQPRFGLNLLTNDLAWWVPFSLILIAAWRDRPQARSI